MDGFAASFAHTLKRRNVPNPDPGVVMQYYNDADLPVYHHLSENFCVCDRWHSSVPGATWPNRLYALTGGADGSRDDKPKPPPIYGRNAFIRHLDAADISWRWYAYDVGTLRCVDHEYLIGHHGHFAYVDRPKLPLLTTLEEDLVLDVDAASFVEDARRGKLAQVSWVDPNFKDVNLAHIQSNDDHPPSDVQDGQELVFLVYNALASGPKWDRTLLLVLYDEHGGFYDHVEPPEAPDDDPATFGRYGIRVPALVVSPWVAQRSVSNTLFDHTSIIKTILTRFCPGELARRTGIDSVIHWLEPGHPHYMGKRVAEAAERRRAAHRAVASPGARPCGPRAVGCRSPRSGRREGRDRPGGVPRRGPDLHRPPAQRDRRRAAHPRPGPPGRAAIECLNCSRSLAATTTLASSSRWPASSTCSPPRSSPSSWTRWPRTPAPASCSTSAG